MINSPMGVTPPHWLMAGVEHRLPLIHYWDIRLPLFPTRTASVTDVEGNGLASRSVHGNPEPGLLCLLPPQLSIASTSASSRQASRKMHTLLCHNAAESAPPHLDPYRHLSGDGAHPD